MSAAARARPGRVAQADPQSGPPWERAGRPGFFSLKMQWVYADPGRIVGLAKSNYIRRVGACAGEREQAMPIPDARERELSAARVSVYLRRERTRTDDLGAHVLVTRGLRVTSGEQLARVLDARERKKDRSYRCYGGQLPRVASHLIASLPYGTTPEQAEGVVRDFVHDISDRLLVPIEAQIHLKDGQPDHVHALLGTRVVENGRLGRKQRALDAVSEKFEGEAELAGRQAIGNTMEWLRSEWARRTRELSGDQAIDHRSYSRRGLAITPVTYVPRRAIEEERQQGTALWRERRKAELAARHPVGSTQRPVAAAPVRSRKNVGAERRSDEHAVTESHADRLRDTLLPPAKAVDEADRGESATLAGAFGLDLPDEKLVAMLREHVPASATTISDRPHGAQGANPAMPAIAEARAADRTAVASRADALLDALMPPGPIRGDLAADDVEALAGTLGLDVPDEMLVATMHARGAARGSRAGRPVGDPIILPSPTSATTATIAASNRAKRTSDPEHVGGGSSGEAARHSPRPGLPPDAAAIRERAEALLDALIGSAPQDGSDRGSGIGGDLTRLLGLPVDVVQALLPDEVTPPRTKFSRSVDPVPDVPAPSTSEQAGEMGDAVAAKLAELFGPHIPGVLAACMLRDRARQPSGQAAAARATDGPQPDIHGTAGGDATAGTGATAWAEDDPAAVADGRTRRPAQLSDASGEMAAPLSHPAYPARRPTASTAAERQDASSTGPTLRTGQAKAGSDADRSSPSPPPGELGQPLVGRYDGMLPRKASARPDAAPEQASRDLPHAVAVYRQLHHDRRMTAPRVEELAGTVGLDRATFEAAASAASAAVSASSAVADAPALPPRYERLVQRWAAEDNEARRERRARARKATPPVEAAVWPAEIKTPPAAAAAAETFDPASPPRRDGQAQHDTTHRPAVPVSGEPVDLPMADSRSPQLMPKRPIERPVTPVAIATPPPAIEVSPATQATQAIAASLDPALVDRFVADIRDAARSQGKAPPSDAVLQRGVALRLRAIGCSRDHVETMLRCCPDRQDVDPRQAATDAFSAKSTDLLRKREQFVSRMRELAMGVETRVYRNLRQQAMDELRRDLDGVWIERRLKADEAARRHGRRLDLLFAVRWRLRRAGRDSLTMAIMTALVELAVLQPLISLQKNSAATERQAILARARRASAAHRASRDAWLRQLDASRAAAATKGVVHTRGPTTPRRRNSTKEDDRSR